MRKISPLLTALIVLMLAVSACGGPAAAPPTSAPAVIPPTAVPPTAAAPTTGPTAAAPTAAAPVPVTGGTVVNVGSGGALGSFLVDSKGMTLYLFTKDTPNTTTCYGKCESNWPPLITTGAPVAGEGVDASKLGTTQRTDGSMQVTYNGWPLYYYAKDANPGDTVGQNVGDVWFVISPAGEQVQEAAPTQPSSY